MNIHSVLSTLAAMLKLTDESRARRRTQILDAARTAVHRHGLEAVTMEVIVAGSGLSTGTVYKYFRGKDDILQAAVLSSLDELLQVLQPVLDRTPTPSPQRLVSELIQQISAFSASGAVDLTELAVHGWSQAQTTMELKEGVGAAYSAFRSQLADVCRRWQQEGTVRDSAEPEQVSELLLSVVLGYVAQKALTGRGDAESHASGLSALLGTGLTSEPA
jgi:TetR/AcrR family transcriptional regulator, transcriptional repressor of aconitase